MVLPSDMLLPTFSLKLDGWMNGWMDMVLPPASLKFQTYQLFSGPILQQGFYCTIDLVRVSLLNSLNQKYKKFMIKGGRGGRARDMKNLAG